MSLPRELAPFRIAKASEGSPVPPLFTDFCPWMGVTLSPGQTEIARVAFDGLPPLDHELARRLFGAVMAVGFWEIVTAVCGARSGKSYILIALRLLHGMLVRDLSTMAPGQKAVALVIARNDKLRREVLNYAIGAVQSKHELAEMLEGAPTTDGFGLRRGEHVVRFEPAVATAGGYGARGRSLTDFAMDEVAFLLDESHSVNDEDIFRAGAPRVLPGGQTIVASTPMGEAGLLYRLWKERAPGCIVVHAPTLLMNSTPATRLYVEREMARDPDNAKREFGAEFMTGGTSLLFEGKALTDACVDDGFELGNGDEVAAGADFGFRSDTAAIVVVALRAGILHVFEGLEHTGIGGPPKPSDTAKAFRFYLRDRCTYYMVDQAYSDTILDVVGMEAAYAPAPVSAEIAYMRARMLFREGRVKIHGTAFRRKLVAGLREVQGRPTSGGGMTIVHPKWQKGGHSPLVTALMFALWQVGGDAVPGPETVVGSIEWQAEQRKKRSDHYQKQAAGGRRRGRK